MGRLTDKQRKQMLADRASGAKLEELCQKYDTSMTTVCRTLKKHPEVEKKVRVKKERNTREVLAFMDAQKDRVCTIIGLGLDALADPEKFADATPAQITTALGTLIDKWTAYVPAAGSPEDLELVNMPDAALWEVVRGE